MTFEKRFCFQVYNTKTSNFITTTTIGISTYLGHIFGSAERASAPPPPKRNLNTPRV